MKLWQGLLLVMLLAVLPALSACEIFEAFGGGRKQQQAYQEQLRRHEAYKTYQEQLKAYREQQEAYNQEVVEAYEEYLNQYYKQYEEVIRIQQEQRQKQLEQIEIGAE